ncbi:MAG: Pr6Pr family membrane protein [Prevotellaceae bacterium]|jgi:membrane-bound metal-dependent hydrolase YbcI (DUF457 family)|nr:Pr6Pr family membrane protein [Prevotellaceae bacterium]
MEKIVANKWKITRIIFNVLIIVCALVGIVIFLVRSDRTTILSTFTIQSNLLCLIAAVVTLVLELKNKTGAVKWYVFFKGMALTSILLTGIITQFVLKPFWGEATVEQAPLIAMADNLLHLIVPLLALVYYVLFEKKGQIKMWHPLGWTAFPFYYVGYTAIYKFFGGVYDFGTGAIAKFPYFFLDYETYGLQTVGLWVVIITVCFIAFSYLIAGFDKGMKK